MFRPEADLSALMRGALSASLLKSGWRSLRLPRSKPLSAMPISSPFPLNPPGIIKFSRAKGAAFTIAATRSLNKPGCALTTACTGEK